LYVYISDLLILQPFTSLSQRAPEAGDRPHIQLTPEVMHALIRRAHMTPADEVSIVVDTHALAPVVDVNALYW
jgi:hypothetical protein